MVIEIEGYESKIHKETKIVETAVVIGTVEMKRKSSVWFNAVVRGDIDKIVIGEYTNIQDCSVVHTSMGFPTIIGDYVVVGHNANLHGCTIGNNTLIGIGAILLDGCEIGDNCMIAAGTLVPPGKKIPPNSMVMGNPCSIKRQTTEAELEKIRVTCIRYYDKITKFY
jgi:carbonic anhydrase/acetyltransferase-like protein (isoleucine patch superfamily)